MLFFVFIAILLAMLTYLLYKAHLNTRQVNMNKISLESNGPNRSGQAIHVLHLSDLHLENISISPNQLFDKLADEQIDLIALTGDFLDRTRSIPKLVPYLKVLNRLQPKYGMYAVFGNHDYVLKGKDFASLQQTLEQNGCKTLQNENDRIDINGTRLNIIGIDDSSTERSDLAASFHGIGHGYRLVLTHDPNIVLNMRRYRFDYLLCGHFHGGQIHWPKPYHLAAMGKLVGMNMIKGLHVYDGKPFYISEGLGQTGVNIRVGSRPEITIHRLPLASSASNSEQEQAKTLAAM
ncbi:metallophosphoesterase [Paenibacillus melissococcoides]|uniref:Metallophosphoesterase n=1 Tax=Paenibacillus melissococcoides TaxID=2912268 RepID=A0ABM9FZ16_9BACL|nr:MULTISPECIES: metallophosphoesterase [Paenibacillus]MEB9896907.1 metallophosphoesterase [Bacillus cereus]CAH8244420.1 metallophosphoesterase [Paenibacillus melissococcoides]CAH8703244.1 metallophosphoesterase [Paenibacillus melissococcoides]CAH8705573.1 metallophosphoesterase [Paenibacillus melissococcoides]GIO82466.1 putative metallophosphoesterase YkoQ [Paenibacillus dendritiformis]